MHAFLTFAKNLTFDSFLELLRFARCICLSLNGVHFFPYLEECFYETKKEIFILKRVRRISSTTVECFYNKKLLTIKYK